MFLLLMMLIIILPSKIAAVVCFIFFLLPTLFFGAVFLGITYKYILNAWRPTNPDRFIVDSVLVAQLEELSRELIQKENIFWVGNGWDGFTSGITKDANDYLFDSRHIPEKYNFTEPIPVENMAKVKHLDLPFQPGFQPTVRKVLDQSNYVLCKSVSELIRKVGFHNVKLYPEYKVVQFQIYDFYGWDGGQYYVYYFSEDESLPKEFQYDKKLDDNWYFDKHPRFP